jgi:hypothetical protein
MMFREAYKNDFDLVRADEAVINNILVKMRREAANPAPTVKRIPVARFAAAAAALCLLVASVLLIPLLNRGAGDTRSDRSAESDMGETFSMTESGNEFADGFVTYGFDNDDDSYESEEDTLNRSRDYSAPIAAVGGSGSWEAPAGESAAFPGADADSLDPLTGEVNFDADDVGAVGVWEDDWSAFVNYNSYTEWPDSLIWNRLIITAPVQGPPVAPFEDYDDYDDYDDFCESELGLPPFFDFEHFAQRFLNVEHRFSSAHYQRFMPLSERRNGIPGTSFHFISFQNIDTNPLYAMLSKYLTNEIPIYEGSSSSLWEVGVLSLNIFTGSYNIFFYVMPSDELIITVAGYSTMFTLTLEAGEYNKIAGFLHNYE